MTSQWAAVRAETDPLARARQLQRSWEHLLAEGALGPELSPGTLAGLRPTIVESWRRSLATGLDPTDSLAPIEADESEVLERWVEHPLGSLTHVLSEELGKVAEESQGMVVVTDASGLVLHRVGDEWLKERAGAEMNLVEGARYSEAADGTNGIGTALAADHASARWRSPERSRARPRGRRARRRRRAGSWSRHDRRPRTNRRCGARRMNAWIYRCARGQPRMVSGARRTGRRTCRAS